MNTVVICAVLMVVPSSQFDYLDRAVAFEIIYAVNGKTIL